MGTEDTKRALVIDDSRAQRGIIGRIIRGMGFEVMEAPNGARALELLAEHDAPDVALVDWHMPEMDGLEFVRAVRKDAKYSNVRIVMVTTETDNNRIVTALEAGADEYVMKPFTADALVGKLHMVGVVRP